MTSRVTLPASLLAAALLSGLAGAPGCGKDVTSRNSLGVLPCAPPLLQCGTRCIDIANDAANCGACGQACPSGDTCDQGICPSTGCPGGRQMCGGICVDPLTNPLNCGACGAACIQAESCVGGSCECAAPAAVCQGVCTDLQTSAANCGACGQACAPDQDCVAGACKPRCASPLAWCVDRCVDLSTDPSHCGACQTACKGAESCVSGTCQCPNDPLHAVCSGTCVNLSDDAENCGVCGRTCSAATHCIAGTCTSCSNGFFYCPSADGDPLTTCLAQAQTASSTPEAGAQTDATSAPVGLTPDPVCQCQHCLTELSDCASDPACTATWLCAMQNSCTVPCWGTMGVCQTSTNPGCFKFCTASSSATQTAARAEALMTCTTSNGCGF